MRRRDGRVRLYTRRGYDWSGRFPTIEAAIAGFNATSLVIDGEAVHCRADGVSDFDALHSRRFDAVALCAFDLLETRRRGFPPAAALRAQGDCFRSCCGARPSALHTTTIATRRGPTSTAWPARWGSRVSSRSARTCPTGPGAQRLGSRLRTRRVRLHGGSRKATGLGRRRPTASRMLRFVDAVSKGDAVSKLDWAGDGAERLEAFAGAEDRHVAIVEHAPED